MPEWLSKQEEWNESGSKTTVLWLNTRPRGEAGHGPVQVKAKQTITKTNRLRARSKRTSLLGNIVKTAPSFVRRWKLCSWSETVYRYWPPRRQLLGESARPLVNWPSTLGPQHMKEIWRASETRTACFSLWAPAVNSAVKKVNITQATLLYCGYKLLILLFTILYSLIQMIIAASCISVNIQLTIKSQIV